MVGRQIRKAGCLLLVVSISCNLGCSGIWRTAPSPVSRPSKVRVDASWFVENPSQEVVQRVTDERQTHIKNVMSQREQGVISVSLTEAISGNSAPRMEEEIDASSAAARQDESQPATTEVNTEPTAQESESGRLMIKVKAGKNYVR